ncbi:MaoC/PaaZ C-terminal domain-containing protein [Arthrobacter alpinus]|nr:MaoC/PaaZ C-terminal domain-containing protein [Arthrobacter alpinus]
MERRFRHAVRPRCRRGAGLGDRELAYTTENSAGVPQQVLPSFATVLGFPAVALLDQGGTPSPGVSGGIATRGGPSIFGEYPVSTVLHARHELTLHRPLPVAGAGDVSAVVTAVHDTGAHALITVTTELRAAEAGAAGHVELGAPESGSPGQSPLLAINSATFLVRGAGGFGGPRPEPTRWHAPDREPDDAVDHPTSTTQGLLYRLSGDRNALHSDPRAARKAGFDRPILHGLCTYGFAARALIQTVCHGDAAEFGTMNARFTSPVFPGDNLSFRIWDDGDTVQFQGLVSGRIVLDQGSFTRRPNVNKGVTND